jgi:hypothetical protein
MYLKYCTLTAEYGIIIFVEGVSLFYPVSNASSTNIFDCINIFLISFASFTYL